MELTLYNTETRQKQAVAIKNRPVRLYTCGPTVYNYAHIGNFRTYVFEDLLRRTLQFFDMPVCQVMNLTDIDDKTLKGAIAKGISLGAFTQPYIDAFFEDLHTLNIQRAEHYPRATDYIPQMIKMIETLIAKKAAYASKDGNVYFSIRDFPSYGRLSHLDLGELKAGASDRVAVDEYEKEQVCDFVLWKAYDPNRDGEIFWDSPFGKGRPGWHIECSAMAIALLGETVDIHVGGVDNMFPHHENEIAQSECCTDTTFVKHWLHVEHLLVDHKKMSKSLGNFYTLRDLLAKGFSGKEIRYMLLQTHYRSQLQFTLEGLEGSRNALARFADFIYRLRHLPDVQAPKTRLCESVREEFARALADDINISCALAALFELVRQGNQLCDAGRMSQEEAHDILALLAQCDQVIGALPLEQDMQHPAELIDALEKREAARRNKNWKEADYYRDYILGKGYVIEDTPFGSRLKKVLSSLG